jgi:hypothetical protein
MDSGGISGATTEATTGATTGATTDPEPRAEHQDQSERAAGHRSQPHGAASARPTSPLGRLLSFPNPVNEVAARVVAGVVVLMCAAMIGFREPWLLVPLCYGFWARVLTGPKLSPLGQLASRVVAPRIAPERPVAGPPKRFAQAMGTAFSTTAVVLWFAAGEHTTAMVLTGLLGAAAFLEAAFRFCLGCKIFAVLMRLGLVPDEVCAECADISLRHPELGPSN